VWVATSDDVPGLATGPDRLSVPGAVDGIDPLGHACILFGPSPQQYKPSRLLAKWPPPAEGPPSCVGVAARIAAQLLGKMWARAAR
jgi:hypothetical protein